MRASISDREPFVGVCLVQVYRAIEGCAVHAAAVASTAARNCVTGAMSRIILAVPYELCRERVQSERLQRACALASGQARRQADEAQRRTTAGL